MKFYINQNDKTGLEKKIEKMVSKLSCKPIVTFSDVKTIKQHTTIDIGERECFKRDLIQAIEVNIEGLTFGEWKCVAEVDYYGGMLLMCDHTLFKSIPSKYGLGYHKCDHCGGTRERKTAFIMHNDDTDEWMQVGSTCVNKMVGWYKYMANLIIELHRYVKEHGCYEEEFYGGSWNAPETWRKKAINYEYAIQVCKKLYDGKNGYIVWDKGVYDKYTGKTVGGTNNWLIEKMFDMDDVKIDDAYIKLVRDHIMALDGENDFNKQMQDAFKDEYIELGQMFLPFFAMKKYEDSIKASDFESQVKSLGYEKDKKIALECTLISKNVVEEEDYFRGRYFVTYANFKDGNGMLFTKALNNGLSQLVSYCTEDIDGCKNDEFIGKTFKFNTTIKFVSNRKQMVYLGGRLSKYNPKKL